jgi:hypothetical protein
MLFDDMDSSQLLPGFMEVIAVLYMVAAFGHLSASIGAGEKAYMRTPIYGKVANFGFVLLDVAVAYGLWYSQPWGVAVFCIAAFTQILFYRLVPEWFAINHGQKIALGNLVSFHAFTLVVFVGLQFLHQ